MPTETTLNAQFSNPDAEPTPWETARAALDVAKTYWLTTVRADGRPHATTVAGVWLDDAFHFVTGRSERKARNLTAGNANVLVITGSNGWDGLDVVIEGRAVLVPDPRKLARLGEAFTAKYDDFFGLRLVGDRLEGAGTVDELLAFEVRASKGFGFGKGATFSQTRWRFV